MGSNPGELLGAQDGQPSFSSSVSSSYFSCLTKFFLKLVWAIHTRQNYLAATFARSSWWAIKLSMTDWSWNADDPKTMNPLTAIPQWNPPFNPAMILRVAIQLVGPPTLTKNRGWWAPDLGPVVGWFQTTGKGWLGCVQNEYQEDVQPYESGIDDTLLQWLARVVLPRVLRFPPIKKIW